ncbi:Heat shock 70 kDa protein 6 [Orchesella cincta]|uniref:Heat shock 70 kDa protein 6 n=1 Tax=Orchesella cincta TaxID=48709 RepID=A0A1D2M0S8_ORCCI|nr:Heat shock 70 kDa protein 6 [Orchesella cincta]
MSEESKKDAIAKTNELYNILVTKVNGYESLIEVLDVEKQTGAVNILLKGISEKDSQMTIGRNKCRLYQVVKAAKSLDDFKTQTLLNLVNYYKVNIEKVIFENATEELWNERHSKLLSEVKTGTEASLGGFGSLNMTEINEELETKMKKILQETRDMVYKTLQLCKEKSLQKYRSSMRDDIEICGTLEDLSVYHRTNVKDIIKEFKKECPYQENQIVEKYAEEIRNELNGELEIQKRDFERRVKNEDKLDKQSIGKALETYDGEMSKHLDKAGALTDEEMQTNHENACFFTISRLPGDKNESQKSQLRQILDKRRSLYESKNEMARSQTDPAIGIDLGTVNCCVAVYAKGKVHIIANQDGYKSTPSYVAYDKYGKLQAIGETAKENAYRNPENTIYDAKRVIGKSMSKMSTTEDVLKWPFLLIDHQGCPKYKIHDEEYEPEDISAEMLIYCRQQAEKYLKRTVIKAVITVPAYFNDDQKNATLRAGKLAGLNVLTLLTEPMAAGIAYGWERLSDNSSQALIFDLGGGTFDVAVIKVDSTNIDAMATDGDPHLGGNDIDWRLVNYCVEQFKATAGIDLWQRKDSTNSQISLIAKQNLQRLYEACEKVKKKLSSIDFDYVSVSSIADGLDLYVKVTRLKLEELCEDLFKRMLDIVDRVINASNIHKTEIDEIILIGGATRTPKIQYLLQSHFNQITLTYNINPDEAVAYGAAVKAAIKNGENFSGMLVKDIQDIVPMSIGIECILKGKTGRFYPIIEKNSKYPTNGEEVFRTSRDNQESGQIFVYQGESKIAADNHLIGNYIYKGIPPGKEGTQKIRVCMTLNENGILEVKVVCESTQESGCQKFNVPSVPLQVVKTKCREPQIA